MSQVKVSYHISDFHLFSGIVVLSSVARFTEKSVFYGYLGSFFVGGIHARAQLCGAGARYTQYFEEPPEGVSSYLNTDIMIVSDIARVLNIFTRLPKPEETISFASFEGWVRLPLTKE